MSTYQQSTDTEHVRRNMKAAGGAGSYCYGLDPSLPPGYSPHRISKQFALVREVGVQHICIWNDHAHEISEQFWAELKAFLGNEPAPGGGDDDVSPITRPPTHHPTPAPTPEPWYSSCAVV